MVYRCSLKQQGLPTSSPQSLTLTYIQDAQCFQALMSLSCTSTTKLILEHTHRWENYKAQAFLHSPDWTCTPPLRFSPGAEPLGSGQGGWEWSRPLPAPGPSYGISLLSLTTVSVWYTGPPLWLKEARPEPTATPGQKGRSQAVALPGSQHGQLCRTPWPFTL